MKNLIIPVIICSLFSVIGGCSSQKDPSAWSNDEINKWFESKAWLGGWNVTPDSTINRRELAVSYFRHKERWDKAFAFLKDNDLAGMEAKKYVLDGDNLFATISESVTKNEEETKYEAHRKYIDIQHVITGAEQMSLTPLSMKSEELAAYDPAKDVEFMSVTSAVHRIATPGNFLVFFPSDIHRPSVKIEENKPVRKIVVKVRVD